MHFGDKTHMSTITKKMFCVGPVQGASLLALVLAFGVAGCQKNSAPDQTAATPAASTPDATEVADNSQDPAMQANLAPAVNTTQAAPAQSPAPTQETAPPPPADESSSAASSSAPSDADYDYNAPDTSSQDAAQPVEYAPQPPPALPEYDQPPCPGDNYLWTPGYWGYANTGYYWVPGVWVVAPYVGSLWTPGYWGFYSGRYGWHHGYWGPHIGFYGGVNYGYGYGGVGYVGGYWHNNAFMYNRSVTRVNETVVRNVYVHNVTIINNTRVSYNGGNGGLRARPLPAENMAFREQHTGPLPEQVNHARQMAVNRQQWASVNHGRPAMAVAAQPLASNRRAPAAMPPAVQRQVSLEAARRPVGNPSAGNRPAVEARPGQPGRPEARPAVQPEARPAVQPNRPAAEANRPGTQPGTQPRPETRPAPANRPEAARPENRPVARPETRPTPEPNRPANRPAPQPARPAVQPQPARPAAQPRPESRPAPEQRPASRPAPQQRPEARPAPQQKPESRPAEHPAPQERHPN
jgi:hypothetical protein